MRVKHKRWLWNGVESRCPLFTREIRQLGRNIYYCHVPKFHQFCMIDVGGPAQLGVQIVSLGVECQAARKGLDWNPTLV